MTEHDRGAYTPHSDAPLAFDPRGPRDRRPIPMALVGSAAVLIVLVAAIFMVYRRGHGGGEGPRPVGAPVGRIKTVAPPNAQPRDPAAGLDVYAAQNVPATPAFAPPPEEPQARPAPDRLQVQAAAAPPPVRIETPPPAAATTTTTTVTRAPPTAVAAAPAGPAATSTTITRGAADVDARSLPRPAPEHAKAMTVASARATDATVDAALAASRRPAATVAKTTTTTTVTARPAAAAAHGTAGVQIGAYSSAALADKGYHDAAAAVGGAIAGHGKAVTPVSSGGKTLYRTVITGFADRTAAKAFCARLSAAGHACIVKG